MKEVRAIQEARGWVAQVVLSRDPLSKEPTHVRILSGFYSTEGDALTAGEASITAPPKTEPTPTKAEVAAKSAKKGAR